MNHLPSTFYDMTNKPDWYALIGDVLLIVTIVFALLALGFFVVIVAPRIRERIRQRSQALARRKPIQRFFFAIGFMRENPANHS
jgi:hypothetical protein